MEIDAERFAPLARLVFAIADPRGPAIETSLEAALAAGHDPARIAEVILQGIPYSGFPGAVEALGALRERSPFENLLPCAATPVDPPLAFRAVYREGTDAVRSALRDRHPDLERWILDFAYGEVMGRGILELAELEGLAVASLIAQRRRSPLHSHLRGALRNGWNADALGVLLDRLEADADEATLAFARKVVEREG